LGPKDVYLSIVLIMQSSTRRCAKTCLRFSRRVTHAIFVKQLFKQTRN